MVVWQYPTVHTTDPDLWPIRGMHDGVRSSVFAKRDFSDGVHKEDDTLIRAEKHANDSIPATPPVGKRQKVSSVWIKLLSVE